MHRQDRKIICSKQNSSVYTYTFVLRTVFTALENIAVWIRVSRLITFANMNNELVAG